VTHANLTDVPNWLANVSIHDVLSASEMPKELQRHDAAEALARMVASKNVSPEQRVLANELLAEIGQKSPTDEATLVDAYCRALPTAGPHNWWGMPGAYVERLGATLIAFGDRAVPCLVRLLDDGAPIGYFGSEDPTLNHMRRYRVRDLAAYFLSEIKHLPYHDGPDPATRDRFIDDLRRDVANPG
jgi:hypothetical protein